MTTSPVVRRGREAGFSLMEIMIAVAIFALTVMTLFVVRGRAIEQAHLARNIEIAERYGKLLLEDILLGNRVYTDGDSGTFEGEEAKDLTYEVFVEEVTVAGTPPEDDGSRGRITVGGRADPRSKMDDLFGSGSSRRNASSSRSSESGGLAADENPDPEASGSGGGRRRREGGGGGGLFGEEESEPEILLRVTVKVHYPVLDKIETLSLETFVPPPPEEDEEATEDGGRAGRGGRQQDRQEQDRGKRGGGRNRRDAADDLFGG